MCIFINEGFINKSVIYFKHIVRHRLFSVYHNNEINHFGKSKNMDLIIEI